MMDLWISRPYRVLLCFLLSLFLFSCGLPNFAVLPSPVPILSESDYEVGFTSITDSKVNGYMVYYKFYGYGEPDEETLLEEDLSKIKENTSRFGPDLLEELHFYPVKRKEGDSYIPMLEAYTDGGGTSITLDFSDIPSLWISVNKYPDEENSELYRSNGVSFNSPILQSPNEPDLRELSKRFEEYENEVEEIQMLLAVYAKGVDFSRSFTPIYSLPVNLPATSASDSIRFK